MNFTMLYPYLGIIQNKYKATDKVDALSKNSKTNPLKLSGTKFPKKIETMVEMTIHIKGTAKPFIIA